MKKRFCTYFGETHDNTHQAYDPNFSMDRVLERAKSHLDFYAAAYYPSTSPAFSDGGHPSDSKELLPLNVEVWKSKETIAKEWKVSCDSIAKFHTPGTFVTFPGYEWQGNARSGDHNVFFFDDYPQFIFCDTLDELYGTLDSLKALAIPHHTAYLPGFRGKDWSNLNPRISPFCEIFSIHGSSEGDTWGGGLISNSFLAPDISSSSYSAALKEGLIVGAIGSTDNWGDFPGHYGHGLAAVQAEELTRESLWEAFTQRRVYALTGDRIALDFTINDNPMGSVNPLVKQAEIVINVEGQDALEYVEIVKNESSLYSFTPTSGELNTQKNLYKVRFEYGWGPSASYTKMDPKTWSGTISVKSGAIEDVTPHLVNGDHSYNHTAKEFSFQSKVDQVEADYKHHNSFVLTLRLDKDSTVMFDVDGARYELTRDQLLAGSMAHFYTEESKELLTNRFDLATDELYRRDVVFGMSYKFKIHRAVPHGEYARQCTFTDTVDGPSHYRVRVRQRNGQMALSSPIWFK